MNKNKTYAVVGMLPPEQEKILMVLKPKIRMSTRKIREKTKQSSFGFSTNINRLYEKGLIEKIQNPIHKVTNLYNLSKKGDEIKSFIKGK